MRGELRALGRGRVTLVGAELPEAIVGSDIEFELLPAFTSCMPLSNPFTSLNLVRFNF